MKAIHPDLDAADSNWIQFSESGEYESSHGMQASCLMESPDFALTPFAYSVWEITGMSVVTERPVAILRANQSTLESALSYMTEGRILVLNKQHESPKGWSEVTGYYTTHKRSNEVRCSL